LLRSARNDINQKIRRHYETVVFDIETCAYPFETLAESQREYLRYADKEPDLKRQMMIDDAVRYTNLYPHTSNALIGIYDVERKNFILLRKR
jgi:hypothetical protein